MTINNTGLDARGTEDVCSKALSQFDLPLEDFPNEIAWCLHELIEQQCRAHPDTEAVCAWDGSFTYSQLLAHAARLATVLQAHGVGPDKFVPIMMEKSRWAVVAMLAVLQAGGALVLLDPGQPQKRLHFICAKTEARIVISSPQQEAAAQELVPEVVTIDEKFELSKGIKSPGVTQNRIHPQHAAYAVFTSGSTGLPKGVVIEHQSIAASVIAHGRALHLNSASRVLQFAACTFDACLVETVTALAYGGCICIPSDVDRETNLAVAARRLEVNWALLTPSTARLIAPDEVPSLKTLVLGGEAPRQDDLARWKPHVRLMNAFGPAECAIITSVHEYQSATDTPAKIGRPTGSRCWIVEEDNLEMLADIEAVGELVVEGPIVGRGYLDDPKATAAAFIDRPTWLQERFPGAMPRIYRTGDLARYHADGSIEYMGRKDSQVKIAGQRLELLEIEHHLRQCLSTTTKDVAVELVSPLDDEDSPILVAFALLKTVLDEASKRAFQDEFTAAQLQLQQQLPRYMIPRAHLILTAMPLNASGKLDRRRLREIGGSNNRRELLQRCRTKESGKRAPSSALQIAMQQLWAEVLHMVVDDISLEDNFWSLGGSSIRAMKLAAAARQLGHKVAMQDIWGSETLEDMASAMGSDTACTGPSRSEPTSVTPFSLVERKEIIPALQAQCSLHSPAEVEDIYPCTPLQEGLFSLSSERPTTYTIQKEYKLDQGIDIQRFQAAWAATIIANPILRTRIVQAEDGRLYQAVIRGDAIAWETRAPEHGTWGVGQPLLKLALSPRPAEGGVNHNFTLVMHHSLTDGWALPLILHQVAIAYQGESLISRPFSSFIQHTLAARTGECIDFWNEQLANLEATPFPKLPAPDYRPIPSASTVHTIELHKNGLTDNEHVTLSTRVRLAWAILISQYTNSPDLVFGATASGRGAPIHGIEKMTGPTIGTVPIRARLNWEETVNSNLAELQRQVILMMPYEQLGLQRIARLSSDAAAACQFQSLLVIQPEKEDGEVPEMFASCGDKAKSALAFGSYVITLLCQPSGDSVTVEAVYDPHVLLEGQVQRLLHQLEHTLCQIYREPLLALKELDTMSPLDLDSLRKWNGVLPPRSERCAHDLVADQVRSRPNAVAVCAWDGDLTYSELDAYAVTLARSLRSLGVTANVVVPLFFGKSRWTSVAILAVLKAGGAFTLLDPSHPEARLQVICRQVQAPLIMTSKLHAVTAESLGPPVVVLNPEMLEDGNDEEADSNVSQITWSEPSCDDPMYVVFTSGSTGEPKGAVMSHAGWCSGAVATYSRLGLGPCSRVLQFSAYAFDVSIIDTMLTLSTGGCLCVPSDHDRNSNLVGALTDLRANWAALTPSVARILNPEKAHTLKHLVLVGETPTAADFQRWSSLSSEIQVMNGYGPAECATLVTLQSHVPQVHDPRLIGRADSAVTWVVDSQDHERLAPIGAVGELLVEGHTVSQGYWKDPKKTAAAFIEQPRWLQQFRKATCRVYKTGDLVQYLHDGSLRYVGRKDTQVKVRGQRVELGEVEVRVKECFAGVDNAVADIVPPALGRQPLLAAWIVISKPQGEQEDCEESTEQSPIVLARHGVEFHGMVNKALRRLEKVVPGSMIPDIFIPVDAIPLTLTGKVNRRLLCSWAAGLSSDTLSALRLEQTQQRRPPVTFLQQRVQALYAEVLQVSPEEVGLDDHFFRRGGDSVLAMRLVALAREGGLSLTVADVFRRPRLVDLADDKLVVPATRTVEHQTPGAFTSLPSAEVKEEIITAVVERGQIRRNEIEDIYPCTPMQDGLMALAMRSPGQYIATWEYTLREDLDLQKLQQAFTLAVEANPILRTRITHCHPHGNLQVVIRDKPEMIPLYQTDGEFEQDKSLHAAQMGLETSLWRAGIIASGPKRRLVLTIHHVLYDGESLPLIWDQVCAAYESTDVRPLPVCPFAPFTRYIAESYGDSQFWQSQLQNLEAPAFPTLPSSNYITQPDAAIHHHITSLPATNREYTLSTTLNLAWAILLSQYTDSDDVVFGLTVNGRSAPLSGIEGLTGPTVATVPFRVRVIGTRSVEDQLDEVQRQITAMTPYEQFGLQNIRKLSEDAARACDFQTHFAVQPATTNLPNSLFTHVQSRDSNYQNFSPYAFVFVCELAGGGVCAERHGGTSIEINASYDSNVVPTPQAQRMVEQFEHILRQLVGGFGQRIQDISALSPRDRHQLNRWNAALPESHDRVLHELILSHAKSHPHSPAISAWDGQFNYQQLEIASIRLARQLRRRGVEEGSIVPICFEKSKWGIVTMLAVLSIGAALVCIDPKYPHERLRSILSQVDASIIIVSPGLEEKLEAHRGRASVLTSPRDFTAGDDCDIAQGRHIWTQDATKCAFIIFTSGSTGQPKGIVMEHRHMATSIRDHTAALGLTPTQRVLHFASYAFDASLYEIFSSLVNGGCLCIPSEDQRLSTLEEFVVAHNVNWALLTPSMLALVDPHRVPCLQTVVAGGEALTRHVVERWGSRVSLINAYGPGETTICAAGHVAPAKWKTGVIGPLMGGIGWVTLASNPDRLAPLGAVGELLIEGPVVTSGYFNQPDLTARGYIGAPAWLVQYRKGKPGRVFRSGDLVELTADGWIRFIGRKDTQVKLRGQRIELAEVEYHVRRCFECLDVVVESVALPGADTSSALVAFIMGFSGQSDSEIAMDSSSTVFDSPTMDFVRAAQTAEDLLRNAAPAYMVPSLFLPLRQFPQTTGGKIDRRRLRHEVSLLSPAAIATYHQASVHLEHRQPTTELQTTIQTVWAHVLNRPYTELGVDANFFHLGGDSISAMQLVSQLNSHGVRTTVAAIFDHPTIARLAEAITLSSALSQNQRLHHQVQREPDEEQYDVAFALSPIQQMFLDRVPAHHQHFNQSFVLALKDPIDVDTIEWAVETLVQHHSMLRARFDRQGCGAWRQVIKSDTAGSYRFKQHRNVTHDAVRQIFLQSQESLNIQTGPLVAADAMALRDGGQYLSLVVHHLVVDIVSWQIILDNLAGLLVTRSIPPPVSVSFQRYCQMQSEEATCDGSWPLSLPPPEMGYWGLEDESNQHGSTAQSEFTLSREDTAVLLGCANGAFQTRPVELLHAALAYSFAQTFSDRKPAVIFSEGHGRDSLGKQVDVTDTVGWFTNIWPLDLNIDPQSDTLLDSVRRIKDRRREVEAESRQFLARHHQAMLDTGLEIMFNYSGASGHGEHAESILHPVSLTDKVLSSSDIGPKVSRFAIFDVLAGVFDSQLSFDFIYPSNMAREQDARIWVDTCRAVLCDLAQQLPALPRQLTRSDLPLMSLTEGQYQDFIRNTVNPLQDGTLRVVDAYPVSPIQEGMLLSQAKDAGSYLSYLAWTMRSRDGKPIDVSRAMQAWQEVVDKHSILRTVFRASPCGDGTTHQLVLQGWRATVVALPPSPQDPWTRLRSHRRSSFPRAHPEHRLLFTEAPDGSVACLLEISHTLLDGGSRLVLLRDLARAYEHKLDHTRCRAYQKYVEYIHQQEQEEARDYWDRYTADMEHCIFPAMSTASTATDNINIGHRHMCIDNIHDLTRFCRQNELTVSLVLQLAWSLVLRAYCRTDDTCFGYMTSGRDTPVQGIQDAVGPFLNLLPCRVHLGTDTPILRLLRQCQTQFSQSLQFQYRSLAAILHQHQRHPARHGPLFNSILSIQKETPNISGPNSSCIIQEKDGGNPTEYDLVLSIGVSDEMLDVTLDYRDTTLTDSAAGFVLDALAQAVREVVRDPGRSARDIPLLAGSPSEKLVWEWNSPGPTVVQEAVTDIVLAQSRDRPQAPAVCSWDGALTFRELEIVARALCRRLRTQYRIGNGHFVPIFASKSRWVPVAMLAVALAGAAFVPLDTTHPMSRLRDICASCEAPIVLTLEQQVSDAERLGPEVVPIDVHVPDSLDGQDGEPEVTLHPFNPRKPLYMMYTSGSTGTPKGVMIDHRALASTASGFASAIRITASSRVLQFGSHAFDSCIAEILVTLMVGGCVCIPSEDQRQNNLAQGAADMEVNWAFATGSLARVLQPSDYPTLRTLVLGGEPVTNKEIQRWAPVVDVFIAYGPTECTIFSTGLSRPVTPDANGRDIGRPFGCQGWVVDPANVDVLLPIGAVGELLIHGPIVGLGYHKQPDLTAHAFIDAPAWLGAQSDASQKLYRTGDLVRLTDHGSFEFMRRKDHQVKLRGQRLELDEVEYHLRQCFPAADDAIVELHTPVDSPQSAALVAFIVPSTAQKKSEGKLDIGTGRTHLFDTPDTAFREAVVSTVSRLDCLLPTYAVPTVFIPVSRIPLTKSGKTDRGCLQEAIRALSSTEMDVFTATTGAKTPPVTEAEQELAKLFGSLFNINQVWREDNFFRLGGDSILAMQLIPLARRAGLSITTGDIFKHPRLCDLATASRPMGSNDPTSTLPVPPFSLPRTELDRDALIEKAAEACGTCPGEVEDVYPCTVLQEGFMALTEQAPGRFVATFEYQLHDGVDLSRFQSAWCAATVANPILRTRIVQLEELRGAHQVVLQTPTLFHTFEDPNAHRLYTKDLPREMMLGTELVNFSMVQQAKHWMFYLTIHHALYDGESMALLWSQVLSAYRGNPLAPRPFSGFIQYCLGDHSAAQFWRSELAGLRAPVWPAPPSPRYTPTLSSSLTRPVQLEHVMAEFTASTLIHLSWAIVMSCYTDSQDVVYGLTLNGRSAPLPGIEDIAGPTIATIPFRVQLESQNTVRAALAAVQAKSAALSSAQQFGLHNIRHLGEDAARACGFQCHLVIQSQTELESNELCEPVASDSKGYAAFGDRALMIVCDISKARNTASVRVTVNYDSQIISQGQAERLASQFSHVLQQLPLALELPLDRLDLLSADDKHQLQQWNDTLPTTSGGSLQDMVLAAAAQHPDKPAISAWDGELSFSELDRLSGNLACVLRDHGVHAGSAVPVCFHRSKWVVVAMLGVLRAGGVCIPLDPGHPLDRIRAILRQTGPHIALVSPTTRGVLADCGLPVLSFPLEEGTPEVVTPAPLRPVDTHDLAFIMFTSGSTGQPKGILLEHGNLCTSISHHSIPCNITAETRFLHFCSHAFDGTLLDIFTVLCMGGCVCIPSEQDRMNDLPGFIARHRVNAAFLVPSLLNRLMQPELVPSLRTILVGGEDLTRDVVEKWASKVTLINIYGPAETTIVCAAAQVCPGTWTRGNIGPITGGKGWVTTPSDPSRLAMVGAVGELLIEGPIVSRGYLSDPAKTADSYLTTPSWLVQFRGNDVPGRLYRTGDLVAYMPDGSIRFVGRKGTQVKMRGQRVELSEVEHHLRLCFPQASEVIAETVMRDGSAGVAAPSLIAMIGLPRGTGTGSDGDQGVFLPPDAHFLEQARVATARLTDSLPVYMVPALFLPLARAPRTMSGKVDRRRLRELAAAASLQQRQSIDVKELPRTRQEELLVELWAVALQIPRSEIGTNDNFFQLGGDSITAMKLASLARRRGVCLSTVQISNSPVLADQAAKMNERQDLTNAEEPYHAGSLLGVDNIGHFLAEAQGTPHTPWPLHAEQVEDILPITEFQHMFLDNNLFHYICLSIPQTISPSQIEAACARLVHHHAMLRTVFVHHDGLPRAVVLRQLNIQLSQLDCSAIDLDSFADSICAQDYATGTSDGLACFKPFLVISSEADKSHMLILRTTHAHYDGYSFPLVLDDLVAACENRPLRPQIPPYPVYLRYRDRQKTQPAFGFWREYLHGAQMPDLDNMLRQILNTGSGPCPTPCSVSSQGEPNRGFKITRRRDIPLLSPPDGITTASMAKAAWALVLARVTQCRDLVFGHTLNGRDAPMPNVDAVIGPCVTLSPLRIILPPPSQNKISASDLLHHVQTQYARAMAFAHLDFQHIRQHATSWDPATQFNSVVTHHNNATQSQTIFPTVSLAGQDCPSRVENYGVPPHLHVDTLPLPHAVHVSIVGPSSRVSVNGVEYLLDAFCEALQELNQGGQITI
ncbi:hypothetical protein ASPVEDRAFT_77120 [Aspergillus versicolor CBS 583.65]|uniref:Carrier domain-containing protein n=1 Tax=Aspergillus versicolor CBS 583.65 TaxID=1036611 RepID=A0A1L9Q3X3_ASPVE|nr:uncharacterized protein ASPVEDRAFT_77120 [Aspergillus versicolor CBS 583.65]OJJ08464.1 hypothetical protein ASPVEDRAFT_77120 [Aspergillus versicolor CBS 583.65]